MIVMRPITEPAVIEELNAGRYDGEVCGYVVMDGPEYLGAALYKVECRLTTVLACSVAQTPLVDGAVRACVAAGENAGATDFCLNEKDPALAKWRDVFCKNDKNPIPNAKIFHQCK